MPDLVFATRGQAEAIAAQEAVARKAREAKVEFEEGAKATQAWDSAQMGLKRSAESALRTVTTEQERIIQQIDKVKAAYREGLILRPEAEEGVRRLRKRWVEVDGAIGDSMTAAGKVPGKLNEIQEPASKLQKVFNKAFDPIAIAKFAAGFVGVQAVIGGLRKEIEDLQVTTDKIAARQKAAYDAAVESGDTATAERLRGSVTQTEALEKGAGRIGATVDRPYLSSDELADLDEIKAALGEGYTERTLGSLGRRILGGGQVRRSDAIAAIETEISRVAPSDLDRAAASLPGGAEALRKQEEQVRILQEMLAELKGINTKEGGIPVSGE